jgi:hypothetical protein
VVKKYLVSLDPNLFDSGEIGGKTGSRDIYFENEAETTLRMVLDSFVSLLPENHKAAVEMCIMSNMTYEEAAKEISLTRGIDTDKKTVWRWAKAGAAQIGQWLSESPWVSPLTDNKIPIGSLEKSLPLNLPWEDDDGEL